MTDWNPRDPVAEAAVARLLADAMPELCNDCGDYKADESTPKWVFRQYDICACPQAIHIREGGLQDDIS